MFGQRTIDLTTFAWQCPLIVLLLNFFLIAKAAVPDYIQYGSLSPSTLLSPSCLFSFPVSLKIQPQMAHIESYSQVSLTLLTLHCVVFPWGNRIRTCFDEELQRFLCLGPRWREADTWLCEFGCALNSEVNSTG